MTKKPHPKKSTPKLISTEVEIQLISPKQETELKAILAKIRQTAERHRYKEQEPLFPELPPAA